MSFLLKCTAAFFFFWGGGTQKRSAYFSYTVRSPKPGSSEPTKSLNPFFRPFVAAVFRSVVSTQLFRAFQLILSFIFQGGTPLPRFQKGPRTVTPYVNRGKLKNPVDVLRRRRREGGGLQRAPRGPPAAGRPRRCAARGPGASGGGGGRGRRRRRRKQLRRRQEAAAAGENFFRIFVVFNM